MHKSVLRMMTAVLTAALLILMAACGAGGSVNPIPSEQDLTTTAVVATLGTPTPRPTLTFTPTPEPIDATIDLCRTGTPMPRTTVSTTKQYSTAPALQIDPNQRYVACFTTNKGTFAIELFARQAPLTVNNFVFLANDGFYDNIIFHRVVKSPTPFVVQAGDPTATGSGGPGYQWNDEPGALALRHDSAGILSMANSGPNTNGSQVFITLNPAAHLDGLHAVFGRVLGDGMRAVNAIEQGDSIQTVSIIQAEGAPEVTPAVVAPPNTPVPPEATAEATAEAATEATAEATAVEATTEATVEAAADATAEATSASVAMVEPTQEVTPEATVEAAAEVTPVSTPAEVTPEATEEATPEATAEPTEAAVELPDLGGATVTVAVENAYPPFNYIDPESGQPVGWDYDAINAICERLNCVPEYIEVAWDGMLIAIANGEYDVAADGITITEERDQTVDFSIGYVSIVQTLLVRIDEDRFSSVDEFVANENWVLGTQPGTTNYETAVELVGESRIVAFDTFGVAVQALIAGDVDAVIIDDTAGQGYVGANRELVRTTGDSLVSQELGFAFPEDSELRDAFNAALLSMAADGTLAEINAKWFGADSPANILNEATPEPEAAPEEATAEAEG